ncbi:hemolytic protein HlpA [Mycobacterium seoulense]|uniref:Hemolytic protein HlpA n=1 Tax=Mycobacterium seoulense TaxID=386911 RepID=A0A7I7NY66_9MYCO|nr:methyltransferase type 11 [Mycobacterium seoulense]BBY00488.1 hemolytic protein HlpA [Mycobacterium seoulense]
MTTTVPIIFIIFNRPDTTRQVFEAIRAARPSKLLVVADGPRSNRPGEAEKCAAARAIIEGVDWDCEVQTNYSEANLGCRLRVSSGITWAFELVDKAIILEDDCVPAPSFFQYCAELLDHYEDDERIMMVSGGNHLFGQATVADSYYFSRYVHIWGWATWRRAWTKNDVNMTYWPEIRDRKLFDQYFRKRSERFYWDSVFQAAYEGKLNTWDFQWVYSIWANSGLCVAPARNLVQNIGFGHAEATNMVKDVVYSSLGAEELDLPVTHPATVLASVDKDELEARLRFAHEQVLPYPLNRYVTSAVRKLARLRRTSTEL